MCYCVGNLLARVTLASGTPSLLVNKMSVLVDGSGVKHDTTFCLVTLDDLLLTISDIKKSEILVFVLTMYLLGALIYAAFELFS